MITPELQEYKRKWYEENKEEQKEKCKEYYLINKEKCKEMNKKWNKNNPDKVRKLGIKRQKNYIKKYPQKVKAHQMAHRIPIPKNQLCEICNKNKAKNRHHPDYSKPLEIVFVCVKCHNALHNKGGN
jgi:hypothetical protein